MALPSSGSISMSAIRTELGVPSQAPFSMNAARSGTYVAINSNSSFRPPTSGAVSFSSWYSYSQTGGTPSLYFSVSRGAAGGSGTACSRATSSMWFATIYSFTDSNLIGGHTYYTSAGAAYNGGGLVFSDGAKYGTISSAGYFTAGGNCSL